MKIGEAVALRIENLCKQRRITINKLSKISGLTQSTLNHAVCGTRKNPTIATIKKVCDGLEMSIQEFFNHEFFENLEDENTDTL